ncbi:hemophore [Mycolicibacterium goodii]|jgi:hemophore|uniref:Fis family transcriptional regulator n=1 Tax=Mycolicibacterium goodii TaxID=134601 RepID=A0A0K0X330_MYCGD|nr:Fis family transcriptional regulator [Mycolicibacterium goodii]
MKPAITWAKHDLRRTLGTVFVATAVGGGAAAALLGPSATAATDPCAASEVARTVGKVATDTGDYLDEHPQTNQALTTISQQQAGPATLASVKTYLDANPQVAKDLQKLQQPLTTLGTRCQLPVTLPQLLSLLQAAQQQGAAAAGSLPGGLPSTATGAAQGTLGAVQRAPISPVSQGSGPLPGPITTPSR